MARIDHRRRNRRAIADLTAGQIAGQIADIA
jgi:hypothetical protein